jgi:hypothetical protein
MTEFATAWRHEFGNPVPVLGTRLQTLYLQWVHRPHPGRVSANMADKIRSLVNRNLVGDTAGLLTLHARVLHNYLTNHAALPRGNNRYLLKCIETALEDLDYQLPATQMVDNV